MYFEGVIARVARALVGLGVPAQARDDKGRTAADRLRTLRLYEVDKTEDVEAAAAFLSSWSWSPHSSYCVSSGTGASGVCRRVRM